MNRFNVLSQKTNLSSHLILEASAGTGKTFSIENLVVRLLIEGELPLTIEQVLIVTFTKAAASDLHLRVRECIEKVLKALESGFEGIFEYIRPFLNSEELRLQAIRRLERAIIAYDEAQIFTIHSFCVRMLSEHGMEGAAKINGNDEKQGLNEEVYKRCVRDYFRSGITDRHIGPIHRKHALGLSQGKTDLLQEKLAEILAKGVDVAYVPSYQELGKQFLENIEKLKKENGWEASKLQSDLEKILPCLNKIYSKNMMMKPEIEQAVERFIRLFSIETPSISDYETCLEDVDFYQKLLVKENKHRQKSFPNESDLNFPDMLLLIGEKITPLLHKNFGIGRMAYDCQQLMRDQFAEEELKSFDDFIIAVRNLLADPQFLCRVRGLYRAVIVDEFQDTDPLQWDIFRTLFPPERLDWGKLFLVGDPKQSIYAFRRADIYTYLHAAKQVGQKNLRSLDTNYRSCPKLVRALNYLFNHPFKDGWIPLPKLDRVMEAPIVQWDRSKQDVEFNDDRKALHFFVHETEKYQLKKSESEAFLPFIVQEIQRLHQENQISYRHFAVLVKDKHQGKRTSDFLSRWKIPSQRQRVEPITESSVVPSLKELLEGICHYRNESCLKTALGGCFFCWRQNEIEQLEADDVYAKAVSVFKMLDETWRSKGISVCLEELMKVSWGEETIYEKILKREKGDQFYADFQHLLELILEEPRTQTEVIAFLEQLQHASSSDERFERRLDSSRDAVQIITIHSSKGLEYGIVFALGLINRSPHKDLYYTVDGILRFVFDPSERDFQRYLTEQDAEKMRQLYVACTRAKDRLYLPVIHGPNPNSLGKRSAMEMFLEMFNQPFDRFLSEDKSTESISCTVLNQTPFVLSGQQDEASIELLKPNKVETAFREISVRSFSSLAQKHGSDSNSAPHLFENGVKNTHTLPAGSETGTLLHQLLEEIPFSLGKGWKDVEDVIPYIAPFTKNTSYQLWDKVLAEVVFYAIKTPFIEGVSLQDVDVDCCEFEMEFLFSQTEDSYLKGFIDLMFFHNGKYYLLDWKSNWLGDKSEGYSKDALHTAMMNHDYYLQARIYTSALKKYIQLIHKKSFESLFGGVFYVFLRGLPTHGIIHFTP